MIRELEGKEQFLGGGEESYGYLIGDAVRDKDAVASCAMIAELTAYAKDQGLYLFDFLAEMYMENNFYYEGLISLTKKGKAGAPPLEEVKTKFFGSAYTWDAQIYCKNTPLAKFGKKLFGCKFGIEGCINN